MKNIILYILLAVCNVAMAQFGGGVITTNFEPVRSQQESFSTPYWMQQNRYNNYSTPTIYTCKFNGSTFKFYSSSDRDRFCELGTEINELISCMSEIKDISKRIDNISNDVDYMYYYWLHAAGYNGNDTAYEIRKTKRRINDLSCDCSDLSDASRYAEYAASYAINVRQENTDMHQISSFIDNAQYELKKCRNALSSAQSNLSDEILYRARAMDDLLP